MSSLSYLFLFLGLLTIAILIDLFPYVSIYLSVTGLVVAFFGPIFIVITTFPNIDPTIVSIPIILDYIRRNFFKHTFT